MSDSMHQFSHTVTSNTGKTLACIHYINPGFPINTFNNRISVNVWYPSFSATVTNPPPLQRRCDTLEVFISFFLGILFPITKITPFFPLFTFSLPIFCTPLYQFFCTTFLLCTLGSCLVCLMVATSPECCYT